MKENSHLQFRLFNPRAILALTLCLFAAGLVIRSFATTPTPVWAIQASPTVPTTRDSHLESVACPSASDCWAVGYYASDPSGYAQTLIEHWDGTAWAIVQSANTAVDQHNYLFGVTCLSASDCWAVGYYDGGPAPYYHTLIEQWDGTSWSIVTSPTPTAASDYDDVQLSGVACASSSDCWAVGYYGGDYYTRTPNQTLIEQWDGTQWSIVPSPNNPTATGEGYYGNYLQGVTCASASECWAVGYNWNTTGGTTYTLIEQWDGTSWSIVPSPNATGSFPYNSLQSVTCTSLSDCWAVGSISDYDAQTVIEHWDGTSWALVSSPNASGSSFNYLSGVTCTSGTECWSVGHGGYVNGTYANSLIEEWDASAWSIVPSAPTTATGYPSVGLNGVACASASACWAVGDHDTHTSPSSPLVETLTTSAITITASASPTADGTTSGGGTYVKNTSVTVTAAPNKGYAFTNWTQGASIVSTSPSYTFTATSNRTLAAHFTPTYAITTSASPTAGGTTTGDGTYNKGATVTVTATSNSTYTFTNWTQGTTIVSHSPSYSFTASANRALVANFTTNPVTLTTSASPSDGGTTTGDGTYASGSSVTAKATQSVGYTFTNWTETGNIVSHSANYAFKLTSNRSLVANFTNNPVTVTATASPTAGGTTTGAGTYASGDNVTVKATPKSGYKFTNWTEGGSVVSTSTSYSFTATSSTALVANFVQTFIIKVSASPSTAGTVMGGGTYVSGANVTVTATPKTGDTFTNWTEGGSVVSTSQSYGFTATANRTLVANFTP